MLVNSMHSAAKGHMTGTAIYGAVAETGVLGSVLRALFTCTGMLNEFDRCQYIGSELLYHTSVLFSEMFV